MNSTPLTDIFILVGVLFVVKLYYFLCGPTYCFVTHIIWIKLFVFVTKNKIINNYSVLCCLK